MKKNIRIVSAAAAALLAVAPVAVNSVASVSADVVAGGELATGTQTPTTKTPTLAFSSTLNDVNASTKVSDLTNDANVLKALKVTASDVTTASIAGVSKAVVSDKANGGTVQNSLQAGKTYYLQAWVTVAGLKKSEKYTSGNAAFTENNKDVNTATSTNQGTFANVKVAIKFNAIDPNTPGQPFFANDTNQSYANGQTIPATTITADKTVSTKVDASTTTKIADIINGMKLKSYISSDQKDSEAQAVSINASDVLTQLKAQKVTVDNAGNVTVPNKGFTLTFTRVNPTNGKKATLNVFFKGEGNYANYPLIKYNKANNKQGEQVFADAPIVSVNLGTKDWATQVLKSFSAQQSTANTSELKLTTQNLSSSDINTNNSGLYNATLKATNTNGLTTTLNFRVAVVGSEKDAVANKTVVGSTNEVVKLVSIVDGKVSDLQGNVVNQGQSIAVYPNDTTTVDGVSYTRVYKEGVKRENTNEWIPTKNVTEVKKTEKTVMHNAVVYNKKGEKTGKANIKTYQTVTVLGDKVKLDNGKEAYQIGDDEYIVVGNVDGTVRTLKHNAYIYATSKKRANKRVVKKGESVRTYGSAVKFANNKYYYRIEGCTASNKMYIKKANF